MTKLPAILFFLFAFLTAELTAQSDSTIVIFTNSQPIEAFRYRDVKGSPYLFDDFVIGNIVSTNIDVYENMALNLNGHTNHFEVRRGREVVELDETWYLRVEIHPELNPTLSRRFGKEKIIFQRSIHPKLQNVFAQVLFAGTRTVFLRTFHADLSKKTVQDVGKTLEFKRFNGKFLYHLIKDGELVHLRLKKKNILKTLGERKEMEAFAKENNIDFKDEKDLIRLVAFYDQKL